MKKILMHLNCLERGGQERVASNLAKWFSEDGYEVVVATEWTGEDEYPLDSRARRVHVGPSEIEENKSRLAKIRIRNRNLRKCLKKERPDIVLAFEKKACYRALIASRWLNIPVVVTARMNPKGNYEKPGDKQFIKYLYPKAAGGIFQSEEMKNFFPKTLQDKSTVIINPLNEEFMRGDKATFREKRIVHVNRFIKLKNQLMLIKAFERIMDIYPEYVVEFYGGDTGDGYLQNVMEYVDNHGLKDKIKFMGQVNHVSDKVRAASCYVITSDEEGLPNSLMEAMAMGVPVISTDFAGGGARTLIKDGENGIIVPINDDEALARALQFVFDNSEKAEEMASEAMKMREYANPQAIYQLWKKYLLKVAD